MQPKTWVKKATQKKSKVQIHDPRMTQVHGDKSGITVATDRGRIHIYNGDLGFDPVDDYPDWRVATEGVTYTITGTVTTAHLLGIAEMAQVYVTKDRPKVLLTLEIHPDLLTATYKGEDGNGSCLLRTGEVWVGYDPLYAVFTATGLATISLDPKFVIDALKGFAPEHDIIDFAIPESQLFIRFQQAKYTAIIAQLRG